METNVSWIGAIRGRTIKIIWFRRGSQGRLPGLLISFVGSIERSPAMAGDLSAYCRHCPLQTFGDDPHRAAAGDSAGDVFAFGQGQRTPRAATDRRSTTPVARQQEMDDLFILP